MIHNNKVYANADEKFVKGTIVYAKHEGGSEYILFHDTELTKPVYKSELWDLFVNGVIVGASEGDFDPNNIQFYCADLQYNAGPKTFSTKYYTFAATDDPVEE